MSNYIPVNSEVDIKGVKSVIGDVYCFGLWSIGGLNIGCVIFDWLRVGFRDNTLNNCVNCGSCSLNLPHSAQYQILSYNVFKTCNLVYCDESGSIIQSVTAKWNEFDNG